MKTSGIAIVLASVLAVSGCSGASQEPTPTESKAWVTTDSVLKIESTSTTCKVIEKGSGFVVSDDHVMTNAHVVAGATSIKVVAGSKSLDGKVVYFDPTLDLAVLQVKALGLPALTIGDELADKSEVTANGYPKGEDFLSTAATKIRTLSWKANDIYGKGEFGQKLYELAAAIEHGNSGGPLLDDSGIVRGVVLGKASATKAYAIPAETAASALAKGDQAGIKNTKCLPK